MEFIEDTNPDLRGFWYYSNLGFTASIWPGFVHGTWTVNYDIINVKNTLNKTQTCKSLDEAKSIAKDAYLNYLRHNLAILHKKIEEYNNEIAAII